MKFITQKPKLVYAPQPIVMVLAVFPLRFLLKHAKHPDSRPVCTSAALCRWLFFETCLASRNLSRLLELWQKPRTTTHSGATNVVFVVHIVSPIRRVVHVVSVIGAADSLNMTRLRLGASAPQPYDGHFPMKSVGPHHPANLSLRDESKAKIRSRFWLSLELHARQ